MTGGRRVLAHPGAIPSGALAAALPSTPVPADQALLAARWTARVAIPVFLVAYLARPLHQLLPSALSKVLLARRRQWGLAFALSMTIHLGALLVNILIFRPRPVEEILAGMAAYSLIFVMALTSNNWSMRRLGKWWKRLHLLGLHYVWLIFFAGRALRLAEGDPAYFLSAFIMGAVLLAALLLRMAAWSVTRRRAARG
ncbi:MAG: hypothetical protein R3E18_10910 [Sphingomonadaceae bacterium]